MYLDFKVPSKLENNLLEIYYVQLYAEKKNKSGIRCIHKPRSAVFKDRYGVLHDFLEEQII